jgi:glycosyltransferase involved in cell wall biosynthesis
VIGQGIDEKLFSFKKRNALNHRSGLKTVHVGRIDPSKEIQELIDETLNSDSASEFSELRLIGAPTSAHIGYLEEIKRVNSDLILSGRLSLFGDIPRRLIPDILSDCDLFVHSFNGSLDKSLVEATMLGIPVVSSNIEYQSIFGTWTKSDIAGPYNLNQEIRSFMFLLKEDSETVNQEIERRLEIALQDHSLEKWIRRLVAILRG